MAADRPVPVHELRLQLAGALDDPAAMLRSPILHRAEALDAVVRIATTALVTWLVAQAWTGARVRPALAGLTLAGTTIAVYGLAARGLGLDRVLWLAGPVLSHTDRDVRRPRCCSRPI
ncbi:MAG: hypothetical protein U5L06_03475 [Rhodovibrio sp.]|nr:hypothetical protein [Rhodovibrio sp.]